MMIRSNALLLLVISVSGENDTDLPISTFPGDGAGDGGSGDMLGAGGAGDGGDGDGLGGIFDGGDDGDVFGEGFDGDFGGGDGGNGASRGDMSGGDGFEGGFDGGFGGGDLDLPTGGAGNPFGGGLDQDNDDFLSGIGDFGGEMIELMFGQCLNNIDMDKLMDDPFVDVTNQCNEQQSTTFNNALDSFEMCAGFDLKVLIENFASMYLGVAMNCGSYFLDTMDELDGIGVGSVDMETLKAKDSPLPRVSQGCVNALVGNNPFGRAFLYAEEYPVREQKCFSELAGKLPMCTLDEWPVPIVGNWLSAVACIYGGAQDIIMPMMQDTVNSELETLDGCIPDEIAPSSCKEIRNKCVFDNEMPALSMAIPPPFWNPPMAETCKGIAAASGMDNVVEKYEAFRQACVPAADLAIWDIAASHAEKNAGNEGGGASYMKATAATPPALSDSSSSTVFGTGLFAGLVIAFVAMFGYNKIRGGGGRQKVNLDDFKSLELAHNNPSFT